MDAREAVLDKYSGRVFKNRKDHIIELVINYFKKWYFKG